MTELLSDTHREVQALARDFAQAEIAPHASEWNATHHVPVDVIRRMGELGLLGVIVPEDLGGAGLDATALALVVEQIARADAGTSTAVAVQNGLVASPLLKGGSREQQEEWLPRLASGEIFGAYALTEPDAGSDTAALRTTATAVDGGWEIRGAKQWITNGGFADVFIVFAKVDGEHFTAFVVERAFGGLTSGKEEHKMGLHGSSTTAVILQDVKVPAENLLGEVGKGHKVAFNVLNFGRFKLGGMCIGGSRAAIGEAAKYAGARKQFGQPIATFGAIRHKLGEMVVRTYAVESLLYRMAGMIDARIEATPHDASDGSVSLAVFEEYAMEASIAKVAGSEVLNYVLDENIQIHGGNGYVKDYPAERHYRDARVNRIFEGTNEINRLLIPGMLARRAIKGDVPIIAAAKALQDELLGPPASLPSDSDSPLADEQRAVDAFKKTALMVFGLALQTYGQKLADQQEVLMAIADIMIDVFSAESAMLRASTQIERTPRAALHADAARVFVNDAAMRIDASARQALAAMTQGDTLRTMLAALRRLLKSMPIDTVTLRRRLADEAVVRGGYIFA